MAFLDEQVPGALLRAIGLASANETATGIQPDSSAVLRDVSSQFPILGLWPIAVLLSIAAIAILAVLLKLVWSLARANLCFFRTYTVHYPSRNDHHWQSAFPSLGYDDAYNSSYTGQNDLAISSRRIRKLVLPAEGFIHLVAVAMCAAVITRLLTVETRGRLAWLGLVNALARNIELACAWTAVLYMALASIRAVPLLSSLTSMSAIRARKSGQRAAKLVPTCLSKPLLHPLLASSLTIIAPLAMCALPIFAVLASSAKSIWAFESMLGNFTSNPRNNTQGSIAAGLAGLSRRAESELSNGVSVLQDRVEQSVIQSLETAAYSYRSERGVHFLLLLGLICIAGSIEWAAQGRLSALAMHLEEEGNSLADQAPDEKAHVSEFAGPAGLHRAPSFASSASSVPPSLYGNQARRPPSRAFSGHGGSYHATHRPSLSSRASSYSHSSSSSSRLHVPQLPELDMPIPSPSLMKECGGASFAHVHFRKSELSPYPPVLGMVHDQRYYASESHYAPNGDCGPGLERQDSRSSASSLAYSHKPHSNEYMQPPRRPPLLRTNSGSMRRTSYRSASCDGPKYCDADHHESLESPPYRRPASRASSYHSRRSASPSNYSRKSSLSGASRRSYCSSLSQKGYTGPSNLHVRALKKARIVDACMLGGVLVLDALLELLSASLGKLVLNSKPLFAIASIASALLHVLPMLGGVILCAIRSSSATYGWTSKHLVVESDEPATNQVTGTTVPYSPFEKADLR